MAESLTGLARRIVAAPDPADKVALSGETGTAWFARRLDRSAPRTDVPLPLRPGRPEKPELRHPRDMPKRTSHGLRGRIAMIHALAHIELNAIDLTWDLIARFNDTAMPRSFFDDFVRIGMEEAKHFGLLRQRLRDLGADYGALPAHDGLWQAADATKDSLIARLAIIPLVLEARGLDITPSMIERTEDAGDGATADILKIIYCDEKGHVAAGAKWFRFLCDREKLEPEPTFHALVRKHFRGALKPPFNAAARAAAGLTPGFYKPLVATAG
ncbi:uncharacterized ferritin-like protein (DUF455 family) [Rhodobium orientis]|uniref:Rhamnosyltransferase n=1 Tax=Rhodobium orientis TaxID=34017 RepID=A0A327JS98_9HYPH|nr:ferritin-like domain-containing protein [Rhodobium orientis]MBB4302631.1 uncharacterized ferritin-like protein (DUF455 family) [Rhodobium orientis]MBK5951499.1 rhamnosyltransferase [Rhodobium orientis]RAI29097.1 rhamnosyltransferase [Rhodobium orientis]